jgi:hypothetical protein
MYAVIDVVGSHPIAMLCVTEMLMLRPTFSPFCGIVIVTGQDFGAAASAPGGAALSRPLLQEARVARAMAPLSRARAFAFLVRMRVAITSEVLSYAPLAATEGRR